MRKWTGRGRDARWTADVLARYGTTCALNLEGCTVVATTGDHIVPRSVDTSLEHVVSNGRPACLHCNQKRGARPLAAPVRVDDADLFESATPQPRDTRALSPRTPENFPERARP